MPHAMRYLNVLGGAAVIAINQLANYLPLNGQTTGEVAQQFSVIIPVARYAFSFWFAIYALIIVFCVYQWRSEETARRLGAPFLASCAFNIAWIFLWHYELIALSLLAVLGLVVSVAAGYMRMPPHPEDLAQYLSVNVFFSVYLAWTSISTVLNGAVVLEQAGLLYWGTDAIGWLVALIALAAAYASWVALSRSDPVFPLAFIWALLAVTVKSWDIASVAYPALAAAVALALVSVYVTGRFRVESRLLTPG